MLGHISSWLTPTSLFIFLNLMIGTIFITSRFSKRPHDHHQQQQQQQHYPHLTRAPSLLERVKSFNLSCYKFPSLETINTLETITTTSTINNHDDFSVPELQRSPSLLERVKSFNFSSLYRSDHEVEVSNSKESELDVKDRVDQVKKSEPEAEERWFPKKMRRSASEKAVEVDNDEEEEEEADREMVEKRRPATMSTLEKTSSFGDEGFDAKCDDFINRFKQQLKLQRLDSLLRYKELLKGGKQNI